MNKLIWLFPLFFVGCSNNTPTHYPEDKHHKQWEEVYKKKPKYTIPGKFVVIDKKSGYHGCTGAIDGYPYLDDSFVWLYYFKTTVNCGGISGFFLEKQITRVGNLSD